MRLFCLIGLWLAAAAVPADAAGAGDVPFRVGSKKFTENVILGELAAQLARSEGARVVHLRELGGTRILWNALLRGEIDAYPEYTGTLREEILASEEIESDAALDAALAARLKLGFGNEFMDREDGWPGLRRRYALPHRDVRGLDHDLAYRGLERGTLHVMDLYATDAEISYYRLRVLADDLGHFPAYHAVLLTRNDLSERLPAVAAALRLLEGKFSDDSMIAMNARAKLDKVPEARVAADFLSRVLGVESEIGEDGRTARFLRHTRDHLFLVAVSLGAAILISLPLGILAARLPRFGQAILGAVGIIQTVPSLALLVFMIPLLGIGAAPAIVALFLYSLLPIVRNTHAGLTNIPLPIRESAEALGLSSAARLRLVELPMASTAILAGIKTSAVINVGTATLGALIGAGGYGQPILTGIRLDDVGLILEGAVPAAALALLAQGLFEGAERFLVPRGLRLKGEA
jgi:osmoprotectant transport system permease protein